MINRDNYLLVREYLRYQDEVMQRDPLTVHRLKVRLKHLLRWADEQSFARAPAIRPVFPRYLQAAPSSPVSTLSPTGIRRGCQDARRFFQWLTQNYRGQFKSLTGSWIDTLQPPRLDALPKTERQVVTLDMVRRLLQVPHEPDDLALRRDKAAVAFLFLTGMRATAFCTLPLNCVKMRERMIQQFPTSGVRTKNRKSIVTRMLEIPDLLQVCEEWDAFLRAHLPETAMWYTVINVSCGEQKITADRPGLFRNNPLGDDVRDLFRRAGLTPMSPHDFRHGHATYALQMAHDVADLKAVSMNLGHSSLTITDAIYAVLTDKGMSDRIAQLGQSLGARSEVEDVVNRVMAEMAKQK